MTIKRVVKIGMVLTIIVVAGVLALTWVNGTSEAGGPGGRGRGGNTGGTGLGTGQQAGAGAGQGAALLGSGAMYNGVNGAQNGLNIQNQNQMTGGLLIDLPPAVPGELPADAAAALLAGIQDEYNAAAIYQSVIDQFGAVRPFTNILRAEQTHSAALAFLLDRYGLAVPVAEPIAVPTFASVQDACAAAAAAEIANFGLYDAWLGSVQNYPDLTQVFTALRDASEFQHLPAFERCAG